MAARMDERIITGKRIIRTERMEVHAWPWNYGCESPFELSIEAILFWLLKNMPKLPRCCFNFLNSIFSHFGHDSEEEEQSLISTHQMCQHHNRLMSPCSSSSSTQWKGIRWRVSLHRLTRMSAFGSAMLGTGTRFSCK